MTEQTPRQQRIEQMAELARQRQDDESAQAQALIDDFLRQAKAADMAPVELKAIIGGRLVRTDVKGWYLRRDHTIAIGIDGGYYRLGLPGGLAPRLRGVHPEPSPPPLVVGRGGKDGESGDLKDFLARVLTGDVV